MATKLTELLAASPIFTDPDMEDFVPLDEQEVYLKQAELFQSRISNLYLDPEELAMELLTGSAEDWEDFLNLEPVKLYVSVRTKNLASMQARKSMKNLQKSASSGDVQAIKYLNELSGVLQNQSDKKVIVLHYIPRPKVKKEKEEA